MSERSPGRPRVRRRLFLLVGFLVVAGIVWEGFKWLFGDPWRINDVLGTGSSYFHQPPLHLLQATDLQLPHVWQIFAALTDPVQRNQDQTLLQFLLGAAAYTWAEAFIGFSLGAIIGITLAAIFVHSVLAERASMPFVITSQTIPIVALAPLIVVSFGRGLTSVVIIATYLTFFPVTISQLRGLRSPDIRAMELMRSYAASNWAIFWKVRMPASLPYLFTALKVAAAASIVGAIIGEGPGGVKEGLGRAIDNFNQQYASGPEKLWAAILIAALTGTCFYIAVSLAEAISLRHRRRTQT